MFEFEEENNIKDTEDRKRLKKYILPTIGILILILITGVMWNAGVLGIKDKGVDTVDEIKYQVNMKDEDYLDTLQFLTYYNRTKSEDMPNIELILNSEQSKSEFRIYKTVEVTEDEKSKEDWDGREEIEEEIEVKEYKGVQTIFESLGGK